jgi:hypothetical protein
MGVRIQIACVAVSLSSRGQLAAPAEALLPVSVKPAQR